MQKLSLTKKYDVYPKYKNILLEESETIPSHWNVDKLSNIGFIPKERNSGGELLSVYLDRGVIRASDGSLGTHAVSEDLSKYQAVKKGDLVLNNQQAWRGSVGVSELEGIISPAYILFRFKQDTFPRYYNYLCRSALTIDQFRLHSKGVGNIQRQIQGSALKNVKTIIPPTEEQERIARFLDEQTARIDETIAKKERLIELLKEKRTATINHAVTKGLDPHAELIDSGIAWIGKIPKGWEVKKVKHTISSITAGVWGEEPAGNDNDIKCLRVADFDYDSLSYREVETVRNNADIKESKILKENDLLIEKSGGGEKTPVGRVIVFKGNERMTCANFIEIVRTDESVVNPEFLGMYLFALYASGAVRKYIKQNTGIQNLDIKSYFSELVCLPSLSEQEKIVRHIQDSIDQYRVIELEIYKSIHLLQEFKSSLISHAVTGKIKV